MLTILTKSREELIAYLTPTNGIVDDNTYIISLLKHNEDPIITTKDRMLSIEMIDHIFTKLSLEDSFSIFNFVGTIKNKSIDNEIVLIVECEDGLVYSGAVADWAAEYCKGVVYIQKLILFGFLLQPSREVRDKLYLAQYLKENLNVESVKHE